MNSAQSSPAINSGYLFAAKATSMLSLLVFYSKVAVNTAETHQSTLKTKPMCTNRAANKFNTSCIEARFSAGVNWHNSTHVDYKQCDACLLVVGHVLICNRRGHGTVDDSRRAAAECDEFTVCTV